MGTSGSWECAAAHLLRTSLHGRASRRVGKQRHLAERIPWAEPTLHLHRPVCCEDRDDGRSLHDDIEVHALLALSTERRKERGLSLAKVW